MKAAVEVRNLNKRYRNGTWANRDITLTAARGELLAILGPNGAGKTTFMRQITTELVPTSGEIRIFGLDAVSRPNEVKGYMGVIPQETSFYWGLSVRQHLRIFGKLRGLPPRMASRRAADLVSDLGLEEHGDKPAEQLSGGLRRRLLVGLSVLADPALLVLDEPSVGLDPESRLDLWGLLRTYRRRGATVLLTTHSMEEAEALCDRVGIIHEGALLASTPLQTFEPPTALTTKSAISPMAEPRSYTAPAMPPSYNRCRPGASANTPSRRRLWKTSISA